MTATIKSVTAYIEENILHSKAFDNATEIDKNKAFNQSRITLMRYLAHVYKTPESILPEDISYQMIWLLSFDDYILRNELGFESVNVDGISVQVSQMDRELAPFIKQKYNISKTRKNKIGVYDVPDSDTFSTGLGRRRGRWL